MMVCVQLCFQVVGVGGCANWVWDVDQPGSPGKDGKEVVPGAGKRSLDVELVHTLMHERCVASISDTFTVLIRFIRSVVCCVRFSADGKYLATGCNRTAQIYDTKTGAKTW